MNQELPPGQAVDEIQALTQVVSDSLAKGEDPIKVSQQLIDTGFIDRFIDRMCFEPARLSALKKNYGRLRPALISCAS